MSGGSKGNEQVSSVSTQTIGSDPLTQLLAGALGNQAGKSTPNANAAVRQIKQSTNASGLTDPSVDILRRTITGEFTDPNALAGQIEAASAPALRDFRRSIAPSIAGRFAASGRTGSGAERGAFQDAQDTVSRNIAEIASGTIQQERDRQQAAAGIFPQVAANERATAESLIGASDAPLDRILQIAGAVPSLRVTNSSGGTAATSGSSGKGGTIGSLAGAGVGGAFGGLGGAALGSGVGATAGGLFG